MNYSITKSRTPDVLSASTLIGTNVKNPQGEDLGEIKEIMLDLEYGRISYAVLSFGGFLGFGDKLFAIPFSAMRVNASDETITLDVDRERLEKAPGFDKDNWPKNPQRQWVGEIYRYYDVKPYWQ